MKLRYISFFFCSAVLTLAACTKNAIDQKTDSMQAVPTTISDFQQLLDGLDGGSSSTPGFLSYRSMGDYLADEWYVNDMNYNTYFQSAPFIRGVLTWNRDLFDNLTTLPEWDNQYKSLLTINLALDGLSKIPATPSNKSPWDFAQGMALFLRGQLFYNLAQFWSQPYKAATAASQQGIVLRTTPDVQAVSVRSTVQATYDQILSDLKAALPLLPNTSVAGTPISKQRPSQAAAYAMLARACLDMGDSAGVLKYADSALILYSTLLDYNTQTSFSVYNDEVLYNSVDRKGTIASTYGVWTIDSSLVALYDDNDLRKTLYYRYNTSANGYGYTGDYAGNYGFTGVATDELYLSRAEAYARLGQPDAAMADLNTLLVTRYKTGTYQPRTAASPADALAQVLIERRKELVNRGLRWADLRRLNNDSRFATPLTRTVLGVTYTLPPGDPRYTLPVPPYVIAAAKGSIAQTP